MNNNKISKIELIAYLKKYKRDNNIKINNLEKQDKLELIELCKKYKLLDHNYSDEKPKFDVYLLSKKQLIEDIKTFYCRKGEKINLNKLKKEDLIDLMITNNIPHITFEDLKKEIEENDNKNRIINILKYNYMKYENFNIDSIRNLTLDQIDVFINDNNLITNFNDFEQLSIMVESLNDTIYKYHIDTGTDIVEIKKTLPFLIEKLKSI